VSAEDTPEYKEETKLLVAAIQDVSARRKVAILTKTRLEDDGRSYVREASILDGNNFSAQSVAEGNISLPDDIRQIPLTLTVKNGPAIDSLAAAAVRLTDPQALDDAAQRQGDALPYGTFIAPQNRSCSQLFSPPHRMAYSARLKVDKSGRSRGSGHSPSQ
jgi:hypothetical protein